MSSFGRVAKIMEESFSPQLSKVVPHLFEVLKLEGAQVLPKGAPQPDDPNLLPVEVHYRGLGDYVLLLNPMIMEKQNMAANMLFEYCSTLPIGFWEYVPQTVEHMKPLMSYAFDANVRIAAIGIVTPLIRSCHCAIEAKKASTDDLRRLFQELLPPFVQALKKEPKVEEKDLTLEQINDTLEAYGLPLEGNQQVEFANLLKLLLDEMKLRRQAYLEKAKMQGMDDEAKRVYEEEIDMEDKFLQQIVLCNKRIAQLCGGSYIQVFEKVLGQAFRDMMSGSSGEICWSLACFDDLIEVAQPESIKAYSGYLQQKMIEFQGTTDEWITQNVAYAVHVLSNANSMENVGAWAQWLIKQIQNPADRSKCSIENCISALGVLCIQRPQQIPIDQALPFFIDNLPITDDTEEVETSTKTLCQIAEKYPAVIQQKLPQVQMALLSGMGSGALSEEVCTAAVKLLLMVTQDAQILGNLIRQLDPEAQQIVLALLNTGAV